MRGSITITFTVEIPILTLTSGRAHYLAFVFVYIAFFLRSLCIGFAVSSLLRCQQFVKMMKCIVQTYCHKATTLSVLPFCLWGHNCFMNNAHLLYKHISAEQWNIIGCISEKQYMQVLCPWLGAGCQWGPKQILAKCPAAIA